MSILSANIFFQELKPSSVRERFSNGNYKGAGGFDADPPPSYVDYGNTSLSAESNGKKKGRKWNFISADESSSGKEDGGDKDEKKVETKSVPFLSLVREIRSCSLIVTQQFPNADKTVFRYIIHFFN